MMFAMHFLVTRNEWGDDPRVQIISVELRLQLID